MRQVIYALEQYHNKNKYFEIGELKEENFYFSSNNAVIQIDPGIFTEDKYLATYLTPPEKKTSKKSDIFVVGMIFFRMVSLMDLEDLEGLFSTNPKHKSSPASPIDLSPRKNRSNSLIETISLFTGQLTKKLPYYFTQIRDIEMKKLKVRKNLNLQQRNNLEKTFLI
jgi:hypothetical protein